VKNVRKSIYQRKIEAVKEIAKAKRLLRGDVGEKIGIKQNTEDKIMRDLVKSKIIGKEHVNIKGYSRVQFFVKKDYKKNLEYILLKEKMKITQRKPIKEMSLNELFTELRRALRGQRKAEIIEPTNVDFWRRKKVFDYLLKHPKEHSTSQISKTLRIGFIRVQLALEHLKKKGFLQKKMEKSLKKEKKDSF